MNSSPTEHLRALGWCRTGVLGSTYSWLMEIEYALAPYPGRGVARHVDRDGSTGWIYFLTGRSQSSRAREIVGDGQSLTVRPTDPGMPADALRHYRCVRRAGGDLLVGNGDHVDVLAEAVVNGSTVEEAARLLEPEPDSPLFTPRIALVVGDTARLVAVRRSASATDHVVLEAEAKPSTVAVLSTYSGTVDQPEGTAPMRRTADSRSLTEVAEAIWGALDPRLRVAMVVGRGRDPHPILELS